MGPRVELILGRGTTALVGLLLGICGAGTQPGVALFAVCTTFSTVCSVTQCLCVVLFNSIDLLAFLRERYFVLCEVRNEYIQSDELHT
jgi:hypothetical protein